jgi:hypothetical protein
LPLSSSTPSLAHAPFAVVAVGFALFDVDEVAVGVAPLARFRCAVYEMIPVTFAVWAGYLLHSTASLKIKMTMAVRIPMLRIRLIIEMKSNIVIIFNPPWEFAICSELV